MPDSTTRLILTYYRVPVGCEQVINIYDEQVINITKTYLLQFFVLFGEYEKSLNIFFNLCFLHEETAPLQFSCNTQLHRFTI